MALSIVFLKMGQPRPLFRLFSVFSNKHYKFLQQIYVKKCASSIWCWDSNPRPLECESHPITTRPELQHCQLLRALLFKCWSHRTFSGLRLLKKFFLSWQSQPFTRVDGGWGWESSVCILWTFDLLHFIFKKNYQSLGLEFSLYELWPVVNVANKF